MRVNYFYRKYENQIIALGVTLLLFLFVAVRFDFYFDLNDDVVMKDILSGAYTGAPESRNIQMLYPVSLLISLLYRVFRQLPVYGIFLCLCQFGCFYLIIQRSIGFRSSTVTKLAMASLQGVVITALFLEHILFVQYTITSALLAGTAAFLFVTLKEGLKGRAFIRKNALSIVLVILSFCIRTEMLALLLPLIGGAGIYKWEKEKPVLTRPNFYKYLTVLGCILAGLIITYGVNQIAYSGEDWQEFMRFFDSRTELYDFRGIPSYEGNESFYERIGFTKNEQSMLIEQYNFGLEDNINAKTLDSIAVYQANINKTGDTFINKLVQKLSEYSYRTFHKEMTDSGREDDYPFNLMVVLGYMSVFIAGVWNAIDHEKKVLPGVGRMGWKLLLIGCIRTALWMFILMRGRTPARITHSLYLAELCILFGILHTECAGIAAKIYGRFKATLIFPAVIAITAVVSLAPSVTAADAAYAGRESANRTYLAMQEYCRNHEDSFYFIDVYSSVSDPQTGVFYSEKMFGNVNNSVANYDIMGGWLVKSPLYEKKLEAFGIQSMKQALVEAGNVYFMAELDKGTDTLTGYYSDQGIAIQTELTDTINDVIGVYKIRSL